MLRGRWLVCWLTAAVVAQAPGVVKLRQDLGDTNATAVAWAAHQARAGRCKQLVAPLQRALGTWRRRDDGDARLGCLHLLDALIALDAKVPAGELLDLVDDDVCGTAAFVLLVREHRTNQAELFALFRRDLEHLETARVWGIDLLAGQRERRTLILGDVLAWHSPPGFVASVAPRCEWRLQVAVHDPGKPPRPGFGPYTPSGPGLDTSPAGWPPRPALWLDHPSGARSGVSRIRILPGLEHVVTREERTAAALAREKLWTFSIPSGEPRAMSFEVQWLVAAGRSEAHPRLCVALPYETDAAFVTAVASARDRVQQCVDDLRTRFVARGELPSADAAKWLPARIEVEVQDLRDGVTTPLPAIPAPK